MVMEVEGRLYIPYTNTSSAQVVISKNSINGWLEIFRRVNDTTIIGKIVFENNYLKFTTRVHEYSNTMRFFIPLSISKLLPKCLNKTNVIVKFSEQNNLIVFMPLKKR